MHVEVQCNVLTDKEMFVEVLGTQKILGEI